MTALLDALSGVRRLAVDAAPFIYLVEGHPQFGPQVRSVVEHAESAGLVLVSSVLTLTEVLTLPFDKGATDLADAYRAQAPPSSPSREGTLCGPLLDRGLAARGRSLAHAAALVR